LGALAAAVPAAARPGSANARVNFGCIGVWGRGQIDVADAARLGNVVAICDVDETALARAKQTYPRAHTFNDYRKMLDVMGKSIDAVTISTPDHHHATAGAQAMQMGKHCFIEKPLAHSLWEIRRLCQLAREHRVATQLGNQGTAGGSLRHAVAMVRAGAIGTVSEVHCWTDRPIWPQGGSRPDPSAPPPGLHWDLWIGPAPDRPYSAAYHPFKWRGYWAFGTGALGDMGCHLMNLPVMALGLRDPVAITAQTSVWNRETYPGWSIIRYEFAATAHHPALTLTWYDGGKKPPAHLVPEVARIARSGSLMVGSKGRMYAPSVYGESSTIFGGVDVGDVKFTLSPGHFEEFVRAIKSGTPAKSNFPDYAGPLSEIVLLGNAAIRASGGRLEWDPHALKLRNGDAGEVLHPHLQHGYRV
jgi:predicted dehydrogenase